VEAESRVSEKKSEYELFQGLFWSVVEEAFRVKWGIREIAYRRASVRPHSCTDIS
jgi:hypothetical protein